MTPAAFHSTPRTRDVLLAQVRAVGLAPRWPVLAAMAVVALATLLVTHQPDEIHGDADNIIFVAGGETRSFHPFTFFSSHDEAVRRYLGTKATKA